MKVVYVNKLPDPFALEVDGRLSLAPLELYPASISFQGVMALVGPDGTTKRNWTDVVQLLVELGKCTVELGTQANPLQVAGNPMSGGCAAYILCSVHEKLVEWGTCQL